MSTDVRLLAEALPPGGTIGILGGGQLGRMLALSAAKLGFRCHIYSDTPEPPAGDVAADCIVGRYDDLDRLADFAEGVDVVTYEFENVPVAAALHLQQFRPVSPPPRALEVAQDRLLEKQFVADLGIPVAGFVAFDSQNLPADEELDQLLPGIVKTRRFGYDGKGQARVGSREELVSAAAGFGDVPLLLEKQVDFDFEVSALLVCGYDDAVGCYDVPRNEHRGGILRRSVVTDGMLPQDITDQVRAIAEQIGGALDYRGVLAVELFYQEGAKTPLVVNEIAPRVHNSGHWTMDACLTDQFENHIRAIARWPIGPVERHSDVEMINLIGDEVKGWQSLAAEARTVLHLYGKREVREGRKMGHVNRLLGASPN